MSLSAPEHVELTGRACPEHARVACTVMKTASLASGAAEVSLSFQDGQSTVTAACQMALGLSVSMLGSALASVGDVSTPRLPLSTAYGST